MSNDKTEFAVVVPVVFKVKCDRADIDGFSKQDLAEAMDNCIKRMQLVELDQFDVDGWEYTVDTYYDNPTAGDGIFQVLSCDDGLFDDDE